MTGTSKRFSDLPPVATFLTARERARVDAAAGGMYNALHRESFDEVIADIRQRRAGAVLVSVARYGAQSSARMAAMVREFPRVPALALLTETEYSTPQAVLSLGQIGVRTLIDARQPGGWQVLRDILVAEKAADLQRSALGQLNEDLVGAQNDCWRFFELLFAQAPRIASVRDLARNMNVLPSTLMSRFFRAHLPPPKRYLSLARLIRAARMFENPGFSIASVANHLDYSSPQSFGRHIRTVMKMSPVRFRQAFDGEGMLGYFRSELVTPYVSTLRTFSPVASPPAWLSRPRVSRAADCFH